MQTDRPTSHKAGRSGPEPGPSRARKAPRFTKWVGPAVLIAVVLYVGALVTVSWLTPGYDSTQQLISELGAVGAPYAWIWRAALGVAGLATLALASSLPRPWSAALAATTGLGLVLGGVFRCDPRCVPVTFAGWTHILSSIPATVAALAGPFVVARALPARPARLSRALGVASVLTIAAAFFLFPACGLPGVGQRLATAVQLVWLGWLAWHTHFEGRR